MSSILSKTLYCIRHGLSEHNINYFKYGSKTFYDPMFTDTKLVEDGVHQVGFSPNGKFFIDKHSTINTLPSLALYHNDGKLVRNLSEPKSELIEELNIQTPDLFTIPTSDGFQMPAHLLKPADFTPNKKYLVYNSLSLSISSFLRKMFEYQLHSVPLKIQKNTKEGNDVF